MPDDTVPMGGSESTGGMPDQPESTTGQLSRNPDPPAPEQPAPSGTPDQGAQLQSSVDSAQVAANAKIDATKKAYADREQSAQWYAQALRDAQATDQKYADKSPESTPVQPTPLNQASPEDRMAYRQINTMWPAIVGLGLLIAGGRGKNAIATKFLVGGMLSSYAKGKTEQAKELHQQWMEQVKNQHAQMQERIDNQRGVLQDQRLSLAQKMDTIKTYQDAYGMRMREYTVDEQGVKDANKDLNNAQKALNRYQFEALKTKGALAQLMKDPTHRAWVADFTERFNEQYGHYPTTDDEVSMAQKMLPWDTYMQYRKRQGKDNPETGQPYAMPSPQPPGQSDKDLEGASDAIGDMIH